MTNNESAAVEGGNENREGGVCTRLPLYWTPTYCPYQKSYIGIQEDSNNNKINIYIYIFDSHIATEPHSHIEIMGKAIFC